MKKSNQLTALLLSTCLLLVSCKDEEPVSSEQTPSVPPTASFIIDIGTFPGQDQSNGRIQFGEQSHWKYAIFNVAAWQLILGGHLIVPVAAFAESFNHEAVYVKDKQQWMWAYEVKNGNDTYEIELYGKSAAGKVDWQMYVSKKDVYMDLLWFEGTSQLDKMGGNWKMYVEREGKSYPYLSIDWSHDESGSKEIKYTSIDTQSDGAGSFVHYGTTTEGGFNTFYNVYMKKENHLIEIDYHSETKVGRVKSAQIDNGIWHCWNAELMNVDCQ